MNGVDAGRENAAKLKAWLEAHADAIPRLIGGRVNKSEIARLAGVQRDAFRTNPECRRLISALEGGEVRPRAGVSPEIQDLLEQKDRKISELTAQVAKREAEVLALRAANKKLQGSAAAFEHMTETMRRLPPPA